MKGKETLTHIFTVVRDPTLTPNEKLVWVLLRSYDSGRGAWPSDYLLASHLDCSGTTIQRSRRSLILRGYLTQELRGPKPAVYRAIVPGGEPYSPEPKFDIYDLLQNGDQLRERHKAAKRNAASNAKRNVTSDPRVR